MQLRGSSKRRRSGVAGIVEPSSDAESEAPNKRRCHTRQLVLRSERITEREPTADESPSSLELDSDTEPTSVDEDNDTAQWDPRGPSLIHKSKCGARTRALSHVAVCGPAYPRSSYDGWTPPRPRVPEEQAVAELKAVHKEQHAGTVPEYTYFRLDNFSIFRPKAKGSGPSSLEGRTRELVTLDRLQNRNGCSGFLFDGVLSCGTEQRYVQSVPFSTLTVDGYGDADVFGLQGRIGIQSPEAENQDVWYQLGEPAQEYRRFYTPFAWLAQFTKYFVDYLLETEKVTLAHFRDRFYTWLQDRYGGHAQFHSWVAEAKLSDFRTTVAAHIGYLWKESCGIDDGETRLREHPIWGEVDGERLSAIPEQRNKEQRTVVTPFAHDCFQHMYFASHMRAKPILDPEVYELVKQRKLELKLTPLGTTGDCELALPTTVSALDKSSAGSLDVKEGDVVCVPPSDDDSWSNKASVWYAYVQKVRSKEDDILLDVLWLYAPRDTTLGTAYYPFRNELFLSDNCSCGKSAVPIECVIGKVAVSWFTRSPAATSGLFVRQKFRTVHDDDMYDFMALRDTDFRCGCDQSIREFEECMGKYSVNDTVLVRDRDEAREEDSLEPAQILHFDTQRRRVVLRRLSRRCNVDPSARPNELVLTEEVFRKAPGQVVRRCHVRFFDLESVISGQIPVSYDRNGACDLFFARRPSASLQANGLGDGEPSAAGSNDGQDAATASAEALPLPTEGWNPNAATQHPKLQAMGIFCGGGNFDRGLEEGGAVEFRYAVDWATCALHSYRANVRDPDDVQFWLGSVNDYLAQAFAGSTSTRKNIAKVGGVDLIAAGSPCPGFSMMQDNKSSEQSLTNSSMVASVVSFVDFYCPRYCVLENVVAMTYGAGPEKDQNVFSQILAAFVAMGYQVQQFHIGAWSFGSSQSRSRVFIVASARGTAPLPAPQYTHGHPRDTQVYQMSLGRSSNGKPFGVRRIDDPTPFTHTSASKAVQDLPDIGDSQPQICPAFPDHRTPNDHGPRNRTRMAVVPVLPHGMGIVQAYAAGLLSGEPEEYVKSVGKVRAAPRSSCFSRVRPDGLFPTIITALRPHDGKAGRVLHWQQHRTNTVMEARRAQGVRDEEVLVGPPSQQIKVIGNSVDRMAAFPLGVAIRQSWEKTVGHEVVTDSAPDPESVPSSPVGRADRDEALVKQSREGTLRLSDAQVADVRTHGFKAILRILESPRAS